LTSQAVIKTWLSAVGKTSFQMSGEILHNDNLVARCSMTRVFVKDGKPYAFPNSEKLVEYCLPSKIDVPSKMSPRPQDAFCYQFVVRWSDIDALEHVNNGRYILYLEDAKRTAFQNPERFRRFGLNTKDNRVTFGLFGISSIFG